MPEKTKHIPIDYNDLPFVVEMKLSRDYVGASYDTPPAPVEKEMVSVTLMGLEVTEVLNEEVKAILQSEAEGFASWD